jgi:hypothetical protein
MIEEEKSSQDHHQQQHHHHHILCFRVWFNYLWSCIKIICGLFSFSFVCQINYYPLQYYCIFWWSRKI